MAPTCKFIVRVNKASPILASHGKPRPSQGQAKAKPRSSQGQAKAKPRSSQGQPSLEGAGGGVVFGP